MNPTHDAGGRAVAIETLESRICLSSPHGGDLGFGFSGHRASGGFGGGGGFGQHPRGGGDDGGNRVGGSTAFHAHLHAAPPAGKMTAASKPYGMKADGPKLDENAGPGAGASSAGHFAKPAVVVASRGFVFVLITLPGEFGGPRIGTPGGAGQSSGNDDGGVAPPSQGGGTITNETGLRPTLQQPHGAAAAQVNLADVAAADDTFVPPAPVAPSANELLAATNTFDAAATDGVILATTFAPGGLRASALTVGSVIERLTSTWHDGGSAGAAGDVAEQLVAQWLPVHVDVDALVATVVNAAGNVLAPAAETVSSVVAPARAAAYDIVHMGSPFTLLADSVATFVEESATVSNLVGEARSRGPWALTAGVIAADLVILSYVYRRKQTRRRAQLAPVGVA